MKRLALLLVVWLSVSSMASASLAPRRKPTRVDQETRLDRHAGKARATSSSEGQKQQAAGEQDQEFMLTAQTEVLLNGKPCRYNEIPHHARIVWMKVAADKKTVLAVHFQTPK